MKSKLSVIIGLGVLLVISSCATTEPLREGELRLLKMQVGENALKLSGAYRFIINFESDGSAEIIRAVCTCQGSGPYIYRPEDVRQGSKLGNFSLWLSACEAGSQRLECYVDYVSDGKKRRSNAVYCIVFGK